MSSQESAQQRRSSSDGSAEDEQAPAATVQPASTDLDADVDAILDEIDSVLEVNAEDFVKSFVQKGGQ
jgi:ubiquitin-like protein Pup